MKIEPRKARPGDWPEIGEVLLAARRFYERHGLALARLTDGRDKEEKLPDAFYVWRGEDGEGGSAVE